MFVIISVELLGLQILCSISSYLDALRSNKHFYWHVANSNKGTLRVRKFKYFVCLAYSCCSHPLFVFAYNRLKLISSYIFFVLFCWFRYFWWFFYDLWNPGSPQVYLYIIALQFEKTAGLKDTIGKYHVLMGKKFALVIFYLMTVYRKFPKYSDTQKDCFNHSKIWTMWLYHRVRSPNGADGMANSADPDQTAPLGGKQCRPWSDCSSRRRFYIPVCVCHVCAIIASNILTIFQIYFK